MRTPKLGTEGLAQVAAIFCTGNQLFIGKANVL